MNGLGRCERGGIRSSGRFAEYEMVKLTHECHRDPLLTDWKKAVKQTIRQRLNKVRALVERVAVKRDRSVECIHHLRTETRRADAALRLFKHWLPGRRSQRLRVLLRSVRHKAGMVRDLDVRTVLWDAVAPQLPEELMTLLQARTSELRDENARSLTRYCKRQLAGGFAAKIRSITCRVRNDENGKNLSPCEILSQKIDRSAARFHLALVELKHNPQQLHPVRIRGRRLRYMLESLNRVFPQLPVAQACQHLTDLQDLLGHANDCQSALDFLRERVFNEANDEVQLKWQNALVAIESKVTDNLKSSLARAVHYAEDVRSGMAEVISHLNHQIVARCH
jgi:CHAD domain-containing protein